MNVKVNDKNKKISHFTKPAPWWGRMGTTDEFRTSAAGTSLAQVDKGVSCVCVPESSCDSETKCLLP